MRFSTFKVFFALLLFLTAAAPARAGELALYYLTRNSAEYEGSGYRQVPNGWELKVKPAHPGVGARWRQELRDPWAIQAQYWMNFSRFDAESGNTKSDTEQQKGDTRLSVKNLMLDVRHPLADSSVEAVLGIQGASAVFERKNIVFNGAPDTASPREALSALGGYMGFHGGRTGRWFFYDWEAVIGHFFLTHDTQSVEGGSIHREGDGYAARLELGYRKREWRISAGYMRQLLHIEVPGGKALASGAAASLPINKIDYYSPFVGISYVY